MTPISDCFAKMRGHQKRPCSDSKTLGLSLTLIGTVLLANISRIMSPAERMQYKKWKRTGFRRKSLGALSSRYPYQQESGTSNIAYVVATSKKVIKKQQQINKKQLRIQVGKYNCTCEVLL